jgi:hypothetical protein
LGFFDRFGTFCVQLVHFSGFGIKHRKNMATLGQASFIDSFDTNFHFRLDSPEQKKPKKLSPFGGANPMHGSCFVAVASICCCINMIHLHTKYKGNGMITIFGYFRQFSATNRLFY